MPCSKYVGKQRNLCYATKGWTDFSKVRTYRRKEPKIKVLMLRDTPGKRGGGLWYNRIYELPESYAKELVEAKRARYQEAKRFVNVRDATGQVKTVTWGQYLKSRR